MLSASFAFILIVLIPFVMILMAGLWFHRAIALDRAALFSVFFVPFMGATSVYIAMMEAHRGAVLIGLLVFIVQWAFTFNSRLFQMLWQSPVFKSAFILASLIRLPASFYDMFLFAFTLHGLESVGLHFLGEQNIEENFNDFTLTLIYTLIHGVVVQLSYALILAVTFGIAATMTALFQPLFRQDHEQ